jgi:hypothetical protein
VDGGYVHDEVLLGPLESALQQSGFQTRRQVFVRVKHRRAFLDLVAESNGLRLAVEAELSSRRVINDYEKALQWGADQLWIVVPNQSVLRAAKRAWNRRKNRRQEVAIFFLTIGQAMQRVSIVFSVSL